MVLCSVICLQNVNMIGSNLKNAASILERIKLAYNLKSYGELADYLGVSPGTISAWKTRDTLNYKLILQRCSDLDVFTLFYSSDIPKKNSSFNHPATGDLLDKNIFQVPLYLHSRAYVEGTFFTKVDGSKSFEKSEAQPFYLNRYCVRERMNADPSNLIALTVTGDSMNPTLYEDDIIIVDKSLTYPKAGSVFLIRIAELINCKRIQKLPGGILQVTNDNQAYKSFDIPANSDDFEILGQVRMIFHRV